MASKTLSSINVAAEADWSCTPYLSIDIDWAHDNVLLDMIEIVEKYSVPTTWFVTHETPLLERLRSNPDFELGIHPNFNFLLNGDSRAGRDAAEVLNRLMVIVPEAKSVRSHSTTQSSILLDLFSKNNLTHECNSFIPAHSCIELKPWSLWSGITRIPYFWEDDVHLLYESHGIPQKNPIELVTSMPGAVKVFDFHPIHVFLNTKSLDHYELTRPFHKKPNQLIKYRDAGYGTRSRLIQLLEHLKNI
jgi:hypothetical protein